MLFLLEFAINLIHDLYSDLYLLYISIYNIHTSLNDENAFKIEFLEPQ